MVSPGDDQALSRAEVSDADAVIIDLSQPMLPGKELARQSAIEAVRWLSARGMDILIWVHPDTAYDDVKGCVGPELMGVLISAETTEEVWVVDRALTTQEMALGVPVGTFQIELVVSGPKAVLDIFDIAKASPRINCLNLNAHSVISTLGVEESHEVDQLLYARGRLLVAARLYGMEAHALAFVPSKSNGEIASIGERALLANKMGYRGAICWDSDEVKVLNDAFMPSQDEIEYARDAKAAMEEAISQGKGAAVLRSGAILDLAMLRHSDLMLSWADAIKRRDQGKLSSRGD